MMTINWNNIRAIEGQKEGFEELVCQLSHKESISGQVHFFRIGKPDGGKECYWEFEDDTIHCWQAKYFPRSFKSNEWAQVNKSVRDAIDNHPKMVKYYICAPIDRPDGKTTGDSMLKKWNENVIEWDAYAKSKGMSVLFEYWGKSELEQRLMKPSAEGLIYYFFNQELFNDDWFNRKNQESIESLDNRYTPKLHFELPISKVLDALEKGDNFIHFFKDKYYDCRDSFRGLEMQNISKTLRTKYNEVKSEFDKLSQHFKMFDFEGIKPINFNLLIDRISSLKSILTESYSILYDLRNKQITKIEKQTGKTVDRHSRPFNREFNTIQDFESKLEDFENLITSIFGKIFNCPYLNIIGGAGSGKSHSLADFVLDRKNRGLTSLLLLGENFSSNESPWTQILRNQLLFSENEEVFLGILNAKAESNQKRLLIVIDALNEGNGRKVWPKRLLSFVETIKRYPWIGLLVSTRDSFEELIAPQGKLDNAGFSRYYHKGFEGLEFEASSHFFKHYKIAPPSTPFLNPEFQNPLFLKLLCEGLKKRELTAIPSGHEGLTKIIKYYIESIELKLSHPDELDYDFRLGLTQKSIDKILIEIQKNKTDHIKYLTGNKIVTKIFKNNCGSTDVQYLKRLISEGLLNDDLYWTRNKTNYHGVYFAYQRFQDHLIVDAMLDKYLDAENPRLSFTKGPLAEIVKDYYNQNLIEALSIQIPERAGFELSEVIPVESDRYYIAEAFIEALTWRKNETINESTEKYVNEVVFKDDYLFDKFLATIISLSIKPGFYFNAEYLHDLLIKNDLSERDAWWTTRLQNKYGDSSPKNSVKRLIDWAWNDDLDKKEFNDDTILLASVTLSWFLTSSNRYLRDGASNGLVCILENRLKVLMSVLKKFEGVNDIYVLERLYGVAYGCALRTENQNLIAELAQYVYDTIFLVEEVCPNILLRDYARGIIEFALYLEVPIKIEIEKIRPPYKSTLYKDYPTNDQIDKKYKGKNEEGHFGGIKWGNTAILRSMTTEYGRLNQGYGDFGRYVFQRAMSDWDIDYNGLSNYAVQRIFEIGYDPALFNEFDLTQGSGRGSGNLERIGKKYQWIIFYELLAKVSDNFNLKQDYSWDNSKNIENYEGTWRPYVRDYDPSITIRATKKSNNVENEVLPWWITKFKIQSWDEDEKSWTERADDLPEMNKNLVVKDENGVEWINLNFDINYKQPSTRENDEFEKSEKRIWFECGSRLMTKDVLNKMMKVNSDQSEKSWWSFMPETSSRYQVFSGEYYWAPSWKFFQKNEYYGGAESSSKIVDPNSGNYIGEGHPTSITFLWEEEFDCSKEEPIVYFKPSTRLSKGLLKGKREGEFKDINGDLVCYDPSVFAEGPGSLLIKKDYLKKYLTENNLNLVWIIRGEKQILGHKAKIDFSNRLAGLYSLDQNGVLTGEMKDYITKY